MTEDDVRGFKLEKLVVPCCGGEHTLHELAYAWPQGFGRFALSAVNPNIGELDERHRREVEEVLGTAVQVIYRHL